jgi:hypothetical protein
VINIGEEQLLSLREAAKKLPGAPHWSTLMRWSRRGLKDGRRLATVKIGGRIFTSAAALAKFAAPNSGSTTATSTETSVVRRNKLARIDRQLDMEGF